MGHDPELSAGQTDYRRLPSRSAATPLRLLVPGVYPKAPGIFLSSPLHDYGQQDRPARAFRPPRSNGLVATGRPECWRVFIEFPATAQKAAAQTVGRRGEAYIEVYMNPFLGLLLSRVVGALAIGGAVAVPSVANGQPVAIPLTWEEAVIQVVLGLVGLGIFYARQRLAKNVK